MYHEIGILFSIQIYFKAEILYNKTIGAKTRSLIFRLRHSHFFSFLHLKFFEMSYF